MEQEEWERLQFSCPGNPNLLNSNYFHSQKYKINGETTAKT